MIKNTVLALALLTAVVFTGCYSAPIMPPSGMIFADISAPADHDLEGESLGSKTGRATSRSILGLIAQGDCSVATAAQNGGITRVHHIDYEFKNIVGVIQELTIVVTGE